MIKRIAFITLMLVTVHTTPADKDRTDTVLDVIHILQKEYTRRQEEYDHMVRARRYRWKILDRTEIPYYCTDEMSPEFNRYIFLDTLGYVVECVDSSCTQIRVAVKSWIVKNEETKAFVTRIFHFCLNSRGKWYEYHGRLEVLESYNSSCACFVCGP